MEEYYSKPRKSKGVTALNVALILIIAILIVIIILFTTTLTTITVSGNSMSPTLEDGDKLVLLKHGYKLGRGDIVVFSDGSNKVKRILGLEGDVIQFDSINMTWVVNGTPYAEEYVQEGYSDNYWTLSDKGVLAAIFSTEGFVVGQGCLFVLGDNRNSHDGKVSMDSHVSGAIQASAVIGKVIKIY